MNIESLVRKAVNELKKNYELPQLGFIAGGSIANLVWQYVSGHEAVINDIDVFINSDKQDNVVLQYEKKDFMFHESSYSLMSKSITTKDRYEIYSVERSGLLNFIYISEDTEPLTILNSFDINCTAVGYDVSSDKVYFLESFEKFLETGELLSINLVTPAHTAIRLAKKQHELKAQLNEREFKIIQLCLFHHFYVDVTRVRFQKKYANLFTKYEQTLGTYFNLVKDNDIEDWLIYQKNIKTEIFRLEILVEDYVNSIYLKLDNILNQKKWLMSSDDLLFFMREIEGDKNKEDLYQKLFFFFRQKDYIDVDNPNSINAIEEFIDAYPNCITNLRGYRMSQQIKIINEVVSKVSALFSKETAIKVLSKHKFEPDIELDEMEVILLGLSVRKSSNKFEDPVFPF